MLKIAVVGTGLISGQHLKAIQSSAEAVLCAICDINETVGVPLAEEYGVPFFKDYKDIPQNTDAEAVILNLPHFLHCEVSEFFLDKGVHVLVEKPVANTVKECDRMIEAAERNNKKLAIGHIQRFYPGNRKVKEMYQSKEIGELCMINELRSEEYFYEGRPKWFLDKKLSGGGVFMNFGAHALDLLFSIVDSKPVHVSAMVGNIKNNYSIEGHAQVHVELENKVSANITICGYAKGGREVTCCFTNGILKILNGGRRLAKNVGNGWEDVELEETNPFELQLAEFCKLIKGERSEIASGEFGRQVIGIVEEVLNDRVMIEKKI